MTAKCFHPPHHRSSLSLTHLYYPAIIRIRFVLLAQSTSWPHRTLFFISIIPRFVLRSHITALSPNNTSPGRKADAPRCVICCWCGLHCGTCSSGRVRIICGCGFDVVLEGSLPVVGGDVWPESYFAARCEMRMPIVDTHTHMEACLQLMSFMCVRICL